MQNIVRCLACKKLELVSTSMPSYKCGDCGNVNTTAFPSDAITRRFSPPGSKLAGSKSDRLDETIVADLLEQISSLNITEDTLWTLAETLRTEIQQERRDASEPIDILFLVTPKELRWSIGSSLGEQQWR